MTSLKWCKTRLHFMWADTTVVWNNQMRTICVLSLKIRYVEIGGPGILVEEIEESLFPRRKNNADRVLPQL